MPPAIKQEYLDAIAPLVSKQLHWDFVTEKELRVLRTDPEGWRRAQEQIADDPESVIKAKLPKDEQERKAYLKLCEDLCNTEATTLKERVIKMKAGKALSNDANGELYKFPQNVQLHALQRIAEGWRKMSNMGSPNASNPNDNSSAAGGTLVLHEHGEDEFFPHDKPVATFSRPDGDLKIKNISEADVAQWLDNPSLVLNRLLTFKGEIIEDGMIYKIVGQGLKRGEKYWEYQYEDSEDEFCVSEEEMRRMLLDSCIVEE